MSSTPLLRRNNNETCNSNSASNLRNYNSIQRNLTSSKSKSKSSSSSLQYLPTTIKNNESPYLQKRKNIKSNNNNSNNNNSNNNNKKNNNKEHNKHKKHNIKNKNHKLNTLNGVTLPTILNVLSILMFLRFGFIIGQMGILGTIFLLLISYGIDLLTTLSISAIATNGIVKGGGAYYMLSRSLGVEFGGAIGVIFYIGQILNSSMNVAGLIEPILYNFSIEDGVLIKLLPNSYWWQFFYSSILLFLCIIIALNGSKSVSKAGTFLCILLILSTLSIPISAIFVKPFKTEFGNYFGLSIKTFKENLFPNFTKGAAGSQINGIETFNDLFGIFFPSTAGILAGASMSGDLINPSKSIPKGTLNGLLITFSSYLIVIISMGSSISRNLLYKDTQILQTINLSPFIILAGEFSTSIFSIIVGIVGAAKLLQAIARDEILPGLKIFGNGDKNNDDPKEAILLTYLICQLFLFADLNQIATLITMAFLMTFIVTNISCALLKIGSAPNFRPSFKYFSTKSALSGSLSCLIAMFIVDGISASIVIIILILLILMIHFLSPPKTWGDVSQSLIYHQVRKYLLKLRQDNVKYWRPQILLLVDNPRTSWKLISFCNNLKKGGLYVIGHVFLTKNFQDDVNELNRSRENWIKIRDLIQVKAFVQISISSNFLWGIRNIYLGSGLGGMKPNITIIGFYDLARYKGKIEIPKNLKFESLNNEFNKQVRIEINDLPTDKRAKFEPKIKITEWVEILEDLSLLNSNLAVAKGFPRLIIPNDNDNDDNNDNKEGKKINKYIDLYPIQMIQRFNSNELLLTSNFDTCTLILQMGAILNTVPNWKKNYKLRVILFVEYLKDVKEEFKRIKKLLEILRMQDCEILIKCFENGNFKIYEYISKGKIKKEDQDIKLRVDELLKEDEWWNNVCMIRDKKANNNNNNNNNNNINNIKNIPNPNSNSINKLRIPNKQINRRMTMNKMNQLGISFGSMNFQTNKFSNKELHNIFNRNEINDDYLDDYEYNKDKRRRKGNDNQIVENENEENENDEDEEDEDEDDYYYDNTSSNSYYSDTSEIDSLHSNNTNNNNILRIPFNRMKSNNSLRKMKRSAFTAERLPNSTIKENAEGNEASIMFEGNKKNGEDGEEEEMEEMEEMEDGEEEIINTQNTQYNINGGEEVNENGEELFVVKFEDMTRRCQFLILNEMMKDNDSELIFSTLPIPEIGLHDNEIDCVDYVVDLELWTELLPPILLLNARTVTVTSNL